MDHTFEEIRAVAIELLAKRETSPHMQWETLQFGTLMTSIADVFERREGRSTNDRHRRPEMSAQDREICREVFWDLFRQGVITLGLNNANDQYPFFSVSQLGKRILQSENTYFFHDISTYEALVKTNVPDINEVTMLYLKEAVQSFKAGCMLASTVMLGVAAEHSFLLLFENAEANGKYGPRFASAAKERHILPKFRKFKAAMDQHVLADLPTEVKEDLDIDFAGILSVIRAFRNDSGHPSGKIHGREQSYVLLQMFVPYCKKIYQLIDFFK